MYIQMALLQYCTIAFYTVTYLLLFSLTLEALPWSPSWPIKKQNNKSIIIISFPYLSWYGYCYQMRFFEFFIFGHTLF